MTMSVAYIQFVIPYLAFLSVSYALKNPATPNLFFKNLLHRKSSKNYFGDRVKLLQRLLTERENQTPQGFSSEKTKSCKDGPITTFHFWEEIRRVAIKLPDWSEKKFNDHGFGDSLAEVRYQKIKLLHDLFSHVGMNYIEASPEERKNMYKTESHRLHIKQYGNTGKQLLSLIKPSDSWRQTFMWTYFGIDIRGCFKQLLKTPESDWEQILQIESHQCEK